MRNAGRPFRTPSRSVLHRITVADDLELVAIGRGSSVDCYEKLPEVEDE
jgi:hypothetical protein